MGDPTVDETQLLLGQYSLLHWVERFPHWKLTGERPGGAVTCDAACARCCPSCALWAHSAAPCPPAAAALLPPAPLPPGVAIQKAAASAEQKDPDQAVADARAKVGRWGLVVGLAQERGAG